MPTVKAIRVHDYGGPEKLRYEDIEIGAPGPGQAYIRHTAIGLNFADTHNREGRYPLPHLPHVLGGEAAGVVEAVGPGVTDVKVGDRVAYAAGGPAFPPGSSTLCTACRRTSRNTSFRIPSSARSALPVRRRSASNSRRWRACI